MLALSQTQPLTATSSHLDPCGFDHGNGAVKLALPCGEIRCPAYILPIHEQLRDRPANGFVEYLEGDRQDLIDQRWMSGVAVYRHSPLAHLKTVDSVTGKLDWGLQHLLGSLSYLPYREVWNLALVASIHDAQALGASLAASLRGSHRVQFNDHKRTSLVSVNVLGVVEEGVGAIAECRHDLNTDGTNLLLDLGNGTTSLSVFGPRGKLEQRSVEPYGVEELIDAIARNLNTRRKWVKEGDRHLIRSGIETRSFTYGNTEWNFRAIYDAELKPWATKALAPVLRKAEQWMASADGAIAIGGGAQLPAIRELLTRKGIAPLSGSVFANALGLLKIAQAKQGQLGG